ncbi:uncharacterized protein LOC121372874 isoform X1 [Gigantopelta aegis]|uniref:uncharacterized protein LOC121372874 isoform X1 n=1 Tax=Gigantopelta aegis TaxID=1735272 RepID=UPI001B88BF98|nr:uncharacterized protein LOC121372874 isoform X1 [Gigantopelta aegis]
MILTTIQTRALHKYAVFLLAIFICTGVTQQYGGFHGTDKTSKTDLLNVWTDIFQFIVHEVLSKMLPQGRRHMYLYDQGDFINKTIQALQNSGILNVDVGSLSSFFHCMTNCMGGNILQNVNRIFFCQSTCMKGPSHTLSLVGR